MKKITKVTTAAIVLATIVSAGAFASSGKKSDGKSRTEMNRPQQENSDGKNQMDRGGPRGKFGAFDENAVIGQIKSVDAKNNKIKISDADGNVTEYAVTGFTKIMSMKSPSADSAESKTDETNVSKEKSDTKAAGKKRGQGHNMETLGLTDLKEGSWVMISTIDGTTKTKQVDKIFVKQAE